MIKRIGTLLFTVIVIIMCCGFVVDFNPKSYSTDKIIGTIKTLTSKDFNGRMAGSPEGRKTEEFIAARFKEMGLQPGSSGDSYFQEFNGTSGNAGQHVLEVLDNGKVVKSYKYGKDYKNLNNINHKGEVTARGIEVSADTDNIKKGNGEITMLKSYNTSILKKIYDSGYKGVIVDVNTEISRRKGQSGTEDKSELAGFPRVLVSNDTYSELLSYSQKGLKIHLKSSYDVKKFTARNVIGLYKSKKPSDKYLIVSAHMDHLGPDPDGTYFPGALDNASGTACMIEVARTITSQNIKPDVNVVFIAFSGEEEGLLGSRYYVQNSVYPLKNTRVINLDMVGAKSTMPLTIMKDGSGHRGSYETDIVNEFENNAKSTGIQYKLESGGNSDHDPFAKMGVPAVTLIDYEKAVYHVPEDTVDNVGIDNLKRAMDITMYVIGEEVYLNTEGGSKQYIWVYLSGGVIIVAVAGAVIYKKKTRAA